MLYLFSNLVPRALSYSKKNPGNEFYLFRCSLRITNRGYFHTIPDHFSAGAKTISDRLLFTQTISVRILSRVCN